LVTGRQVLYYAWAAIGLLVVLNLVVFGWSIIVASDTLQVQYMPDDAYYYLVLARNWSTWRTWTFDGGHSVATGFHPLWAYLMVLVSTVAHPTSAGLVRWSLALSSVPTTAALLVAWWVGLRLHRPSFMALLTLLATSRNVISGSVSGMEWSLVLLLSVLYWMHFAPRRSRDRGLWGHMGLFTLGLLGNLARSEFGLLALSLYVACLAVRLVAGLNPGQAAKLAQTTRHAFWGLAGATVGLLLVLGHNYAIGGGVLQSSARMKAFWGTVYGSAHWRVVKMMLGLLFPLNSPFTDLRTLLYGLLVALGLCVVWKAWRRRALAAAQLPVVPRPNAETLVLLAASVVQLLGSLILYSRAGLIPYWYTANVIVPIALLLLAAFSYVSSLQPKAYLAWVSSAIVLAIVALNVSGLYPIGGGHAPMPHQRAMLRAGKDLAQRELDGTVGSWNAGIVAYYQGGTVINLDGLVNDGIYPWVIDNNLLGYLVAHEIRYVIDFEDVFMEPQRQQRGGYYGVNLLDRLEPVEVYDQGRDYWKPYTLYRVVYP
jgi:hypothetical protein